MYPGVWPGVVAEVAAAGHEPVGFVQFVFSGIDRLLDAGVIRPGVRWANAAGVYGRPVAEIALTLLLSQLHHVKAATLASSFSARGPIDAAQGWLIDGGTVAIIGAGGITDALIPMLRPFGVKIIAVNRSGRPVEGADETYPQAEAGHVWEEADAFILAAPLTDETSGVVDAGVLARMKRSAVVVNVGRGELIVTDDLVAALRDGEIAGAAMDVTDPEPLPDGHPLWRLPNCTIAPQVIANAAAFEAGERMPTEVDITLGY